MKIKNLFAIIIILIIVFGIIYSLCPLIRETINNKRDNFSGISKITLKAEEEKKIGDFVIKMKRIAEDSRCPVGAQCI